jgi:hypothetical protein
MEKKTPSPDIGNFVGMQFGEHFPRACYAVDRTGHSLIMIMQQITDGRIPPAKIPGTTINQGIFIIFWQAYPEKR